MVVVAMVIKMVSLNTQMALPRMKQEICIYLSDSHNNRVQVFNYKGQFLSSFGKRGAASKQLHFPRGTAVDANQLVYVCDKGNECVLVFRPSGEFVTSFGRFSYPAGIVIDDDGFVYVSDYVTAGKVYIL